MLHRQKTLSNQNRRQLVVKYISKQTLKYVANSFARTEMTMKRIVAVKSEEVWRWS